MVRVQVANEALLSLDDRQNIDLSLAMSMEAQGSRSLHAALEAPSSLRHSEASRSKQTLWQAHSRDAPNHHTSPSEVIYSPAKLQLVPQLQLLVCLLLGGMQHEPQAWHRAQEPTSTRPTEGHGRVGKFLRQSMLVLKDAKHVHRPSLLHGSACP